MVSIDIQHAFVDFPIFDAKSRSLKKAVLGKAGGKIGTESRVPIIEALKPLSFFVWTAGHRPMAGVTDWPAVAALGAVDVVLIAIGVIAFTRRDLGSSANVGWLRAPSLPAGTA